MKYAHVFHDENTNDFKGTKVTEHQIVGDAKPIRKSPFEVTAMDVSGPYPVTPKGNKFLFTFTDHFSRYVEAYPIPDQKAETCAQIYATQLPGTVQGPN